MRGRKKEIEFELNLVPFIDMLSSCLSFLLLTAVWTYVGTLDTTQAIGAENAAKAQNPPSVVVQLDKDNSFDFQLKDVKTEQRHFAVPANHGQPNWERVNSFLKTLKKTYPEINTSVVLTRPNVTYGHTIKIVDSLKKVEIKDVGISPI
jgi:biopolymer transport protein ExbD